MSHASPHRTLPGASSAFVSPMPAAQPHRRQSRILVVDDNEQIRTLLERILVPEGHDVRTATDGLAALAEVRRWAPDVVLLDVEIPGMDGFEVCRQLKADPATRLTPVVLLTALSSVDDRIVGLDAGADEFLSKPVHVHELKARIRSLTRVKRLVDALDSAETAFIALAMTIEARDPGTNGHCERLAQRAVGLGKALGLPAEDLDVLRRGGYLHDIGKVGVPDAVLLKPGRLTPDEYRVMQRHTEIGDALCTPLQSLRRVRPIVRSHHERLDGSGYPDGLRGDSVPLLALVVGVVDVFDALISDRPYRPALRLEHAIQHLRNEVDRGRFSPRHVEAFLDTPGLAAGL